MEQSIIDIIVSRKESEESAIVCGESKITYRELYRQALGYSYCFNQGEVVGVVCTNTIEFVIVYFAVVMANGTVLLLNENLKNYEIIKLCRQCGADRLINTSQVLGAKYGEITEMTIETIDREDLTAPEILENRRKYDADKVITLIPTSGTTNQAKIVCLTHKSFVNGIANSIAFSERAQDDIELILLSFSTRIALEGQLLTCLSLGIKIVLYNELLMPRKVFDIIKKEKISLCSMVPSVFCALFEKEDILPSSLRALMIVGEKLSDNVLKDLMQKNRKIAFLYGYGLTETGPITFKLQDDYNEKIGSAGKVIPGNKVLFSSETVLVDGRYAGNISVRSSGMMRGYYNYRGAEFEGGILETGDIGYMDQDGYLYILGRTKNVINRNGYKIFPEEIENIIINYKGIRDVLVEGEKDNKGLENVVAYIVSHDDRIRAEDVIQYCRNYLADYKVPQRIYFCDEIAKTDMSQKKKRH